MIVKSGAQTVRGNIIVVDDQPANLKLMEDMLRQQRYDVRSFPRGRMALTAAVEQPPDLILLDINMPEMNGFEVCERLKADQKLALIPVIFLSALNETDDKVRAFRWPAVSIILPSLFSSRRFRRGSKRTLAYTFTPTTLKSLCRPAPTNLPKRRGD